MKKHVLKLLLILLMLSFLGFTSFFVVHVHASTTIPSGVAYYVSVTLTNSQNSAVSSGSQVSITVNWANYAFYLDNPVDNYVFFNSAGSTLYSWLESGTANTATSALLWLKIDSSIAASGGTYTVYLGFYAKGDDVLSSAGATGWAPQLSGTYGQYDNGANVFLVYFNGNSDLSNFQVDPGSDDSVTSVSATFGSSTIDAIMYTVGDNENSNDGLMYTGQNISASQNAIAESSFSSDGSGTDLGAIGLGSNDGQGVANNFISTSTQYSGAYFDQAFDDNTFSQNYVDFNEQGSATTAWRYASITYNSTDYYGYIAPQLYSIGGGYDGTVNYADQGQSNPFAGVSTLYLFFYPDVGGSGAWIQYNWARVRLYPPNGIMPSSSFGSGTAAAAPSVSGTPSTVDQGQPISLTSTVTGGTSPYSYQWMEKGPSDSSFSDISGVTSRSYSFVTGSSTATGLWSFELQVTDGAGAIVTSNVVTVTVDAAPTVSVSPTSWTMDVGQSTTFTATASGGSGTYTGYRWYVDGVLAQSGTASVMPFTPGSSGSYLITVTVTDSLGVASALSSVAASVTVNAAPTVSVSPSSWTMDAGQSKTFSATPSGGSVSYTGYQWYVGGVAQSGQTASTFSYSPVSSGSYSITVTVIDSLGATSAQSSVAMVTVNSALVAPTVTPTPGTVDQGQTSSLTSTTVSTGTSPLQYQWMEKGPSDSSFSDISGATSRSYSFVTGSSTATGLWSFELQVTDGAGAIVTSNVVTVTVNSALVAPTASASLGAVDSGQTSSLTSSTVTTGTPSYTYQWYSKLGAGSYSSIGGAASTSYSFVTSTSTAAGNWSFMLQVTDSVGVSVNSTAASVTVNSAPTVSVSPAGPLTMDVGQSQTFTASASGGTSPYTYQWYLDGVAVGTNSASYSCTAVAGSHQVYVNVTDSASTPYTAKSNVASFTVNSAPSVTVSPSSVTVDVGQGLTFMASASGGSGVLSYQWCLDGSAVSGETGSTYTFTAGSVGSFSIYVNVTDSSASVPVTVESNTATVTVNSALVAPTLTPTPSTVDQGQTSVLSSSAVAAGTSPYTYEWFEKGPSDLVYSLISSAALDSYSFVTSTFTATGVWLFEVQVTDATGAAVNSTAASVTVNSALVAPMVSASLTTVDQGQTSSLTSSTVTTGTSPLQYQWMEMAPGGSGFSSVGGATSDSYSFVTDGSTTARAWSFELQVTDSADVPVVVTSNVVTVTVNSALATPVVTPAPSTVDQGQTSSLTSTDITATGTGPYTYQWLQEASGATSFFDVGTNSQSFVTGSLTATGLWSFELQVTDGAGAIVTSNVVTVTVDAAPTVSVSPTSWTMDVGQSTTFTATASGGSGTYSSSTGYQWYVDSTLQSGQTASTFSYSPVSSGSHLITVTVTDSLGVTSALSSAAEVTVNHASAVSITLSPAGSATITAGNSKTYSATGFDAYGNTWDVTSSTSWSISSGAGGSWSNNVYTSATAGSWTVTGTYNSAPYTTGLTVNPAAATHLVVSSGTSQVAGTAFSVTVTAEDAYGNTATGYTGTVHFSSSDSGSGVSLPSDYTFLSGDLGTHTFTDGVTLVTAGTESVTATDTVTESITGSQSGITVDHASAVSIAVTPATATITAGNTETYTATASDAYGNSWDVTSSTSWSISSGAGGSWSNNVYTSATAGSWIVIGTYNNAPYTAGLTVNPAGLDHFVFGTVSSQTAGSGFSISITAQDASGNTATSYSGTPTLTYSAGSITPSSATGGFSNGVWTSSVTVTAAGSDVTLGVDDGSGHTGTSNTFTVSHAAAASSVVVSPAGSSVTAGAFKTYSATATDAYGNSWDVTSSTTWSISSGAGGSWLGNVYTSATAGSWTVTGTYDSVPYTTGLTVTPAGLNSITISPVSPSIVAGGSQAFSAEGFDQYGNDLGSITASYSVNGASITGSSVSETLVGSYTITASCGGYTADATLTVNAGALDHFVFSSVGSQTAGSAFSIMVTAVDASGNTVTGYTGTQSLSYSAGTISPSTMGAFVNGVGTTTVTVTAAGSGVTITATDGSHTGTSNSFTVNPTIAASAGANGTISPSGSVSVNYGSSQSFTITPCTGYSIASLTVDGSQVTVASSYTFSNVQAAHTITASFAINTTTTTIIIGIESNTTIVPIILEGNITAQQMLTNITITPNPLTTTTTLSFTITGPSGTVGFGNMTLPKTAILYGTNPVVYIDGQQAPNQGYTQDANNFYVWYTTHFSTHQVTIQFTAPPATSLGLELAIVTTVAAIILIFIAIASQRLRRKSDNTLPNPEN